MRKILLASLILILGFNNLGISQERELSTNIGLFGGLNINMHNPDFYTDGINNLFTKSSTGIGGNFGLIGNFPIDNTFVITSRLGYNMLNGELEDANNLPLNTNLAMFEITPGVQFHNLISGTDLYFLAGLEFGIPLTKNYEYEPTFLPEPISEDIPGVNTRIALALGVGYMFEISEDIYLTPEVSYRIPFSKVSNEENFTSWDVPQLRAGVSITFGFGKDGDTVKETPQPSEVSVGFKEVRAYDKNGNHKPADKITVEEVQYAEQFPLIPYVFFPEKSDVPDKKTQSLAAQSSETGSFNIEMLTSDAEKINSSTLDIVGTRMQKDKNIAIRIVGTLDGKAEANNKELAQKRAEFVKNYLVKNYGIAESRITAEAGALPSKPSSLRDPLGVEENRRVEIYPLNSNSNLFEPIVIQSDRQRLASPDVVEFIPYADSQDSIAGWELEIMQSGKLIKKYSGEGVPNPTQWSIMPNDLAANEIPIDYSFKAWTANNKYASENGTLPVEYFSITRKKTEERADRTISKFSLMLFDFNSPDVSELDQRVILNSIIPEIKFNSTVQIYGYTDLIGDADYNKKLALQRANSVRDILQYKVKDA
ncbi:MAG: OmpA family protein, partial [Candidatus Kapaibacterium sp.]